MNGHVLDLTRYHFRRQSGDITLYGSWLRDEEGGWEPALVLVPTHQKVSYERTRPCCIALSSAYRYDEPSYLLQRAMEFNRALGFTDTLSNVHRLASLIYDNLQELIELPPRPVREIYVGADAVMTDQDSGRTVEAEILEYD